MCDICYNCFQPKSSGGSCPHCGYDQSLSGEDYPQALPHGTILNGQYILGRVLGQGGFGITYVAQDYRSKKQVAVKEYLPDGMAARTGSHAVTAYSVQRGESFQYGKECFLKEAQTLAEFIGNPNIVRVHSYFEENGTAYFVMAYVEGISFQQFIKDQGGKVSWQEAERILLPVMGALGAVHGKGIIHRDVTPDNIFITRDGAVKLLDFGAARYSLGERSRSLDVVLKHGFAPREQYTRRGRQGPYTDVYSVAASFYYAITGRKPPDAIDRMDEDYLALPSSLGIDLPAELEDAIIKGLSVHPADRFQSMEEFQAALNQGYLPESGLEPEQIHSPDSEQILSPKTEPEQVMSSKPEQEQILFPEPELEQILLSGSKSSVLRKLPRWVIPVVVGVAAVLLVVLSVGRLGRPKLALGMLPGNTIAAGYECTVGLKSDGTMIAVGDNSFGQRAVTDWSDMVSVSTGIWSTVGLKSDGTVMVVGDLSRQNRTSRWSDIVSVLAGGTHIVGLKSDGTVVAVGSNKDGQCKVSRWSEIVAVAAGRRHTVGLKSDGTVVAVGWNRFDQCEVSDWNDIVAVSAGNCHTVGLKSDGTVVAVGAVGWDFGQCDVSSWRDIIAVSAGEKHTVGLKLDGTVVAVGENDKGQCEVADWRDIVAVSAGSVHTVGLKSDGTVVAVGSNGSGRCEVSDWTDIAVGSGVVPTMP